MIIESQFFSNTTLLYQVRYETIINVHHGFKPGWKCVWISDPVMIEVWSHVGHPTFLLVDKS